MEFGELKNVDLQEAWPDGQDAFRPWLADNLERLSIAICAPLAQDAAERRRRIGDNILAHNSMDGSRVLIKTQLESTDYTHLGEIIAYMAHLEAQAIIWVARAFQELHISAIRWLNEHTTDPYAFFAVRVRVVQIADGPLAPLFEVLEGPSWWERQVPALTQDTGGNLSEIGQTRRDFWRFYGQRYPDDRVGYGHDGDSVWHLSANNKITIVQYLAQHSVGIYISELGGSVRQQTLRPYQEAVAAALGVGENGSSFRQFRSSVRSDWPDMTDWLHNQLAAYRRIIEETHKKEEELWSQLFEDDFIYCEEETAAGQTDDEGDA